MKRYILIDVSNLFFRCKHVTKSDTDTKIGMTIHIILNSILHVWNRFNADHVVFCFDGKSWRKDYYKNYKIQRKVKNNLKSQSEKEEDELFLEALNDFSDFLENYTNTTVIKPENLEADDIISIWCDLHESHEHIIVSSDKDFIQLINEKVSLYDGVKDELYTIDGIFDNKNQYITDKKTNMPKTVEPEWELFKKIIRGDSSDNIFSAYPGIRETKIKKAFNDRQNKGYDWNNFMLSTWSDGKKEFRVIDCYNFNKLLIDLKSQPEHIINEGKNTINSSVKVNKVSYVGIHFLKFCKKWNLVKIYQYPDKFVNFLNSSYD